MIDGGDPRGETARACARPDAGCGQVATSARAAKAHAASTSVGFATVSAVACLLVLAAAVALVRQWLATRRRP